MCTEYINRLIQDKDIEWLEKEADAISNIIDHYSECINCIVDTHCSKINIERRTSEERKHKWLTSAINRLNNEI